MIHKKNKTEEQKEPTQTTAWQNYRMERWKKGKMEILDFRGGGRWRWRNGRSEQVLDGQIERRRARRESSGRLRVTGNDEEHRGGGGGGRREVEMKERGTEKQGTRRERERERDKLRIRMRTMTDGSTGTNRAGGIYSKGWNQGDEAH